VGSLKRESEEPCASGLNKVKAAPLGAASNRGLQPQVKPPAMPVVLTLAGTNFASDSL
jgi:hypothetical protein